MKTTASLYLATITFLKVTPCLTVGKPPPLNPPEGFSQVELRGGQYNKRLKLGQTELDFVLEKQTISIEEENYPGRAIEAKHLSQSYRIHCFERPHQSEVCWLFDETNTKVATFIEPLGHLPGSLEFAGQIYPVTNGFGPEEPLARDLGRRTLTISFGTPALAKVWFSRLAHYQQRYWESQELSPQKKAILQVFSALLIQNAHYWRGRSYSSYPFGQE